MDLDRIYASMEIALLNRIFNENIISDKTYLEMKENIYSNYKIEKLES